MSKKTIGILLGIVAILIVAAIAVPKIYADRASSDVAAPTISASPSATAEAANLDGTWTIAEGSYAGYRLDEVLSGEDVTVVGRTEDVTGSAVIASNTLNTAEVVVDLSTVATDSDRRDNYFRTQAIDTSVNPNATFSLTEPVVLSGSAEEVTLTGEITINGVTQPATVTAQVAKVDDHLEVAGSTEITWADFNVEAPDLGFVKVEESGFLEFLIVLAQ